MTEDARTLPIFPLPNVVLFPGGGVPLHVFEPRYRQMMQAALEGDRTLGMVSVAPEHHAGMAGDPPVYRVGCAGEIAEHELLADGRYNLLLRSGWRFEILEELPREEGRLYRVARVRPLPDRPERADAERMQELRGQVMEALEALVRHSAGEGTSIDAERLSRLDDERFTNTLCQALGLDTPEKQGLLELDTLSARTERLEGLLQFHLAAGAAGGAASSRVH